MHTILWMDNDVKLLKPDVDRLKRSDFDVHTVGTVSDAVKCIQDDNATWSAIIIDVMMGVNDGGREGGLEFYRQMKHELDKRNIVPVVYTRRSDEKIRNQFGAAGLPPDAFFVRGEIEPSDFAKALNTILGGETA